VTEPDLTPTLLTAYRALLEIGPCTAVAFEVHTGRTRRRCATSLRRLRTLGRAGSEREHRNAMVIGDSGCPRLVWFALVEEDE